MPLFAALVLASGCTRLNGAYDPEGDGTTQSASDSVTSGTEAQTGAPTTGASGSMSTTSIDPGETSHGTASTSADDVMSETSASDTGPACTADGRPVFTVEDAFLVHGPACANGCDGLNFGSTPEHDLYDLGSDAAAVLLLRFDSLKPDADAYTLHVRSTVSINAVSLGDTLEVLGLRSDCIGSEGQVDAGTPVKGDMTWNHCAFPMTWPGRSFAGADLLPIGSADLWAQHDGNPTPTEFVVELVPDALEPFLDAGGNTLVLRTNTGLGVEFSAREGEGAAWVVPVCTD